MDCGPAALKCLLEGHGISASYERLREACQTGIDGSSIDTLEAIANQMGLQSEQIMVPADHVLLDEANTAPAIVVVKRPGGLTHFVVLWRKHANKVQVMDPVTGRRWVSKAQFKSELYHHTLQAPAADWREFAGSAEFQHALQHRLKSLGVSTEANGQLRAEALADDSWRSVAALDAAVRLVGSLVESRGIDKGCPALRMVRRFSQSSHLIPSAFWSVRESETEDEVLMTGAVLVRVIGRKEMVSPDELGQELSAAVKERPISTSKSVLQLLSAESKWSALLIGIALVTISLGLLGEALLFRTLFDVARELGLAGQRMGAMAAVVTFSSLLLVMELFAFLGVARIARLLESRLRVAFLRKIPKLGDRYFQSRLISDMAERSHLTHRLRHLPDLLRQLLHSCCELFATAGAIIWLEPFSAPFVLGTVAAALIPSFTTQSILREGDLRVRSHAAGLTRFYLDATVGLQAIRAHAAELNIRREHEKLLGQWAHAVRRLQQVAVSIETIQLTLLFGLIAGLFLLHPISGMNIGRILLVAYWALNLPTIGQDIGTVARQVPYYRNLTLRLLDPLRAAEEETTSHVAADAHDLAGPATLEFRGVRAMASGQTILTDVSFSVPAGNHVAIVGSSGAGKSSIAGVLLGWLRASEGEVLVDGRTLNAEELRASTAWVDPAVQIWNDSLHSNLGYGCDADSSRIGWVVDAAMLRGVLETLPEGLQTKLGESGGLLSGGEGQRVRLGRAILKANPRLVILDEPFRGLDREKRREFLARARQLWRDCTLLCITHDLAETTDFDQILVVDLGRVVENDSPGKLSAESDSRYSQLLHAERVTNNRIWSSDFWRRIRIHSGRIVQEIPRPSSESRPRTEVA